MKTCVRHTTDSETFKIWKILWNNLFRGRHSIYVIYTVSHMSPSSSPTPYTTHIHYIPTLDTHTHMCPVWRHILISRFNSFGCPVADVTWHSLCVIECISVSSHKKEVHKHIRYFSLNDNIRISSVPTTSGTRNNILNFMHIDTYIADETMCFIHTLMPRWFFFNINA